MKKTTSKIVSVGLAAAMIVSLAACSSQTADTPTAGTTTAAEPTTEESTPETQGEDVAEGANEQADIIVIGAGGAGMTAAIQAAQDGAVNVVIVEKMPVTGGNTIRSTGGLNAAGTTYQAEDGIEDSVELFVEDTMTGGKNLNDEELVRVMAENSAAAVDWVNEIGGDLSVVGMFGGASVKRIHRPSDTSAVGPMLVRTLNSKVEELGIPVLLETKAEQIILDEQGKVSGVTVSDANGTRTIDCRAVILATGGFGANEEMVVANNPGLAGFGTTNHSGAAGDGILMAEAVGAGLVDMDQIQTHPTVEPVSQTMYTEAVRGNGAILVNLEGKRFIDELETRDVVSEAILAQSDEVAYLVFDQAVRESLSAIETYIKQGIVVEADTPEELAELIGIDGAVLAQTLTEYAGYVAVGEDPQLGRDSLELPLDQPKYYAALCAPAIHHTMGGVRIDVNTQVIDTAGNVIPGFFAAGEVIGGLHGANRLGGNAVTDIVVFGRIAGSSAIAYVEANGGSTEQTIKVEKPAGNETVVPEVQGNYKDGVYTGTGKGNNGDIIVEVTVEDGSIISIQLVEHGETAGLYEAAEAKVVGEIIRTQETAVDGVTGATRTGDGIKEAVEAALADAR